MFGFIDTLVSAIGTAEGFYNPDPNVKPRRNHNPGNLTEPDPTRPGKLRFKVFKSDIEGIAYLYHQVALDIRRGLTLRRFLNKYAPPNENNTENYIKETVRRMGGDIDPDRPMMEYLEIRRIP